MEEKKQELKVVEATVNRKITNNENQCNCNIPLDFGEDYNEKFRNKLIEMGIIGKPVKNVD